MNCQNILLIMGAIIFLFFVAPQVMKKKHTKEGMSMCNASKCDSINTTPTLPSYSQYLNNLFLCNRDTSRKYGVYKPFECMRKTIPLQLCPSKGECSKSKYCQQYSDKFCIN